MRQKRAKSYKKQMLVYNHTFKFREPYQIIVDEQIVSEAFESNYNLYGNLKKTLQAENIKLMITQCCMQKLYLTNNQELIDEAKRFERRRCNHSIKEPKEPVECVESIFNIDGVNKHRYVLAAQNIDLRRKLRKVPGVPIVHLSRSVMIMEPISDSTIRLSKKTEQSKLYKGLNDPKYKMVKEVEEKSQDKEKEAVPKRKRGAKEPNPLSMKKKVKVEPQKKQEEDSGSKKRKRRHRPHGKGNGDADGEAEPEPVTGADTDAGSNTSTNNDDKIDTGEEH